GHGGGAVVALPHLPAPRDQEARRGRPADVGAGRRLRRRNPRARRRAAPEAGEAAPARRHRRHRGAAAAGPPARAPTAAGPAPHCLGNPPRPAHHPVAARLRRRPAGHRLVIWLAAEGLFENPVTVAVALGLGNGAALLGGWAVIARTRYQTAGRALTLLA